MFFRLLINTAADSRIDGIKLRNGFLAADNRLFIRLVIPEIYKLERYILCPRLKYPRLFWF